MNKDQKKALIEQLKDQEKRFGKSKAVTAKLKELEGKTKK